jgi:transposase
MNSWSFYELQRQIEYKARWLGLPVTYVRAYGTSSKCAEYWSKIVYPKSIECCFVPVVM